MEKQTLEKRRFVSKLRCQASLFPIYPNHHGVFWTKNIYELYVRPHLYYDDIIYHKYDPEFKFFKLDFTKKLESIQYSAALAVTGAWRGTNTDRLCEEVGWEILYYRKWYRCLCHFYKLRNKERPYNLCSEIRQ